VIDEDRVDRANDLALLAVDTDFGVDVMLRGPRGGMDAGYRADIHARSIVGTQTGDDVGHSCPRSRSKSQIENLRFQTPDLTFEI
jgi:hypothetical protein